MSGEDINQAIEQVQQLPEKQKSRETENAVRRLPADRADLKQLRDSLLSQIEGTEQDAAMRDRIEWAISESKAIVERKKFQKARKVINRQPDSPSDLKELKKNLLDQIADVEKEASRAESETAGIMRRLQQRGVDFAKLSEIAKDNEFDLGNPMQFRAFLMAVEKQLG